MTISAKSTGEPATAAAVDHVVRRPRYAYDNDPLLDSGTEKVLAAAAAGAWTVIDMAADWSAIDAPLA